MKNHIRIIVQGPNQSGEEFASDLEHICNELATEHKEQLGGNVPQVQFMTTASDGRQTATIQFTTINSLARLNSRSVGEVLSLFKGGEERYLIDPVFRQTIDSLCTGGAPEKVIEQLIGVINAQQDEIQSSPK
jgi:hypothetical protein